MISQSIIDAIFESDPEYKKHFILENLNLKKGDFLYFGLKQDSSGKDLESIVNILSHFYDEIENLGLINLAYSFKEIESFTDIAFGSTLGFAQRIEDKGGKFVMLEPKPKVRMVLEITGLDEISQIYDSERQFIEEMNK